ncbi:MAG: vitamin K epoxide reductase family protein [Candidatus Micrarchaeota archaeon]|nr:vitamin K epoxide reductase family protein [Candidatus Micrarchaeota archaeon]
MPARKLSNRLSLARIAIVVVGLLSSVYLAYSATFNVPVACPTTQLINCDAVLGSAYANTFGVPNGYLGIAFFLAVLALIYLKKPEPLALLNAAGIAFVAYFIYAEYRIGSICLYCTLVHVCTLALLAISLYEISGS